MQFFCVKAVFVFLRVPSSVAELLMLMTKEKADFNPFNVSAWVSTNLTAELSLS